MVKILPSVEWLRRVVEGWVLVVVVEDYNQCERYLSQVSWMV